MRIQTTISVLAATALALASLSVSAQGRHGQDGAAQPQARAQIERGQRDFDRGRQQDRDRTTTPSRDRDRDQDRTKSPEHATYGDEPVYGSELMSVEERNQYREQLRLTESDPQARTRLEAQHKEEMQRRAKEQGVTLESPVDDNDTD